MQKIYRTAITVIKNGRPHIEKCDAELYAVKKIVDIPEQRHYAEKSHLIGLYRADIKPCYVNSNWFIAPIPFEGSKTWITAMTAAELFADVDWHMV